MCGTVNQPTRRTSRWLLIITLASIFLAAHPFGPLRRFEPWLWSVLHFLAIDISMTPFTQDMILLAPGVSPWRQFEPTLRIVYQTQENWQVLPAKDFAFYGITLPVLYLSEYWRNGYGIEPARKAICRFLTRTVGEGEGFAILIQAELADRWGWNRWHPCT